MDYNYFCAKLMPTCMASLFHMISNSYSEPKKTTVTKCYNSERNGQEKVCRNYTLGRIETAGRFGKYGDTKRKAHTNWGTLVKC